MVCRSAVHQLTNSVPGNSHRRYGSEAEAVTAYNQALAAGLVRIVHAAPAPMQVQVGPAQMYVENLTTILLYSIMTQYRR